MNRLRASARTFAQSLRNRSLRLLLLAAAGSTIGTWAYLVALVVYAYDVGGATGVAIASIVRNVPAAIAAPLAGVVGDRYPRLRVMIGSDLIRAVAMGLAAATIALDGPAAIVFAMASVTTVTSVAFRPAQVALQPSLARTPDELTASNAAASTIEGLGFFLGPALGGLLLAATDASVVFAANGATFLWSAMLLAGLRGVREGDTQAARGRSVLAQLAEGFAAARDPGTRIVLLLTGAQTLVYGALSVLVAVLALEVLDVGPEGVGFLNAAFGAGGLLASFLTFGLVGRRRLASAFGVGIFLWGAPIALVGVWPEQTAAFLLLGITGAANTLVNVSLTTVLQRTVDGALLARVFGLLNAIIVITIAAGAVLAPLAIAVMGPRGALVVTGILLPTLAVLSWRRLSTLDRAAEAAERPERTLLEAVPMFAVLPPPTLEQLSIALQPVELTAGAEVFRQGDSGDRFYVIADGSVDVHVDDVHTGTLWPGESFGEIAILRDVPRTATVIAREPTKLFALERDDFLTAVTGSTESLDVAESVVGARLGMASPSSV